jgi:hypothetical protein
VLCGCSFDLLWAVKIKFGLSEEATNDQSGKRARPFKAVSPGLLPPLGILFALCVAFTASQVWRDNDRANSVVDREASALRAVVILAGASPYATADF